MPDLSNGSFAISHREPTKLCMFPIYDGWLASLPCCDEVHMIDHVIGDRGVRIDD